MIKRLALPFIFATGIGDGAITQALVDRGADANTAVKELGTSLLQAATTSCNEPLVDYLLKHGATIDVNALFARGTLMEAASACGLTKFAGTLLAKGADPNKANGVDTPLSTAILNRYGRRKGNSDMVAFLLDHGASANGPGGGLMCVDRNMVLPFGAITALHHAVSCGYIESAAILVKHGADIEAKGSSGETPMHAAAAGGNLDAIRWLLDHHANINPKDKKGETPLSWAQRYKHPDAIKLLIANGAQ